MKTRACLFCGKQIELKRTTVWAFDHFLGKCVRAPVGPFPDRAQRAEILEAHEFRCGKDLISRNYGERFPLEKWGVSRTPTRKD